MNDNQPAEPAEESDQASRASRDLFATTHWSVVAAAANPQPSAEALDSLCRTYWYPLYAYVRHKGASHEDAEDLTQAFFLRFTEKSFLDGVAADKGKFRAYLLAAFKHFLSNERDRTVCLKRGGKQAILPLDWQSGDTRYAFEPTDLLSPDKLYDRAWATALLEKALSRLREESQADDKLDQFEKLKVFLSAGKGDIPHARVAAEMNWNEGRVRVAVHRLRHRYRFLLREEVGRTLADPQLVQEEMDALFRAFSLD